jgi:hypothetical protein
MYVFFKINSLNYKFSQQPPPLRLQHQQHFFRQPIPQLLWSSVWQWAWSSVAKAGFK